MGLNLFRRAPAPSAGPSKSTAVRLQESLGDVNKLPTIPAIATRAMAVANDPNSSLMDFSRLVQRDPPLTAGLLKLANSPLYQVGRPVQSVEQAVVRLGLRNCQNLIVSVGMRSLFQNVHPSRVEFCEQLWEHSFLTALVCRNVNKVFGLKFAGEEFTAGLLHDLGRIVIAVACPNDVDVTKVLDLIEGPDVLEREQEEVGADHCYLGGWFALQNKLPPPIITTIRHHHTPGQVATNAGLVAVVALAEHMTNYLLGDNDPNEYRAEANGGFQCLTAEWSEDAREKASRLVPLIVTETARVRTLSRKVFSG
jgi:HD-like signal output (HDOD) protein